MSRKIELAEGDSLPVITGILLVIIFWVYYLHQSSHALNWIDLNALQADKLIALFNEQKYVQLIQLVLFSNFVTANLWQLFGSAYFLMLFGIGAEKRLGTGRFIILALLSCVLPWLVQVWDVMSFNPWGGGVQKLNISFFSPALLTLSIASAYLVVIPRKKRSFMSLRLQRKDRTEIFNRAETPAVSKRFGMPPEFIFIAFIIYEVIQRVFILLMNRDYDSMGLYSALSAMAFGSFYAGFVKYRMQNAFQEHPLKHAAIKRYHELRDLDVDPDVAIRGAAQALGLPDYQVEAWVKQNKGRLRTN